ncbi:hypothetical protein FBQ97_07925 [Acidobacteria bacterium ACD]|nr:MAG: hypothetical protein EDX89_01510 [Acidobacteriota bacterium]MCE7958839.1 hypothetical protein [Acidobacteria bacterium ACB2]MDL1949723.1 hypothetical protein [Acidobacteria bacterium ACD]
MTPRPFPTRVLFPLLAALLSAPPPAAAAVVKARIEPFPPKVGRLYAESPRAVKVVVRDERPADPLVAWGVMGFNKLIGFYVEDPGEVPKAIQRGATDALAVLGVKEGEGAMLEVAVKELRIDAFAPPFGALPNEIAYGRVEVALKPAEGEAPPPVPVRIVLYGSKPISVLLARIGWEVAGRAFPGLLGLAPDPEAVRALCARLGREKDDDVLEHGATWLGFAGAGEPAAAERLLALFRTAEDQSVYQAAAVSLGRLGTPGAEEELDAVLTRKKKLPEWDPAGDAENSWHLLYALHLLGEKDLAARVPPVERWREKLTALVGFLESGQLPPEDPKLAPELAKAREKATKKMKD